MYFLEYRLKNVLSKYLVKAKSGVINQLTLGDRPVDRDRLVGYPSSIRFIVLRCVCSM